MMHRMRQEAETQREEISRRKAWVRESPILEQVAKLHTTEAKMKERRRTRRLTTAPRKQIHVAYNCMRGPSHAWAKYESDGLPISPREKRRHRLCHPRLSTINFKEFSASSDGQLCLKSPSQLAALQFPVPLIALIAIGKFKPSTAACLPLAIAVFV